MKHTKRKNIQLFHKKILRKVKRRNKVKKQIRIKRSQRPRYKIFENREKRYNDERRAFDNISSTLIPPINFSLIENTEEVIQFINAVDKVKTKRHKKIFKFELLDVVNIEICALSLLLTKINELSSLKKHYFCSMPRNIICRKIIEDSGFLDQMRKVGSNQKHHRNNDNLMVTRGFDKTDNRATGLIVKKSVEYLTLEKGQSYRPLYSIIQEICSNSIEHGNNNIEEKNWLMAVNFKTDEIEFTLTDIGEGIIKTIKKKGMDTFKHSTGLMSSEEVLLKSFEKQYNSRTLDINRNKGLPKIYDVASKNYIENLIVITNNVLMDFSNLEKTRELKINFNGTFYFWKLTKNCIEKWRTRTI